MLSVYNYKLSTRRFVSDLFDKVEWIAEAFSYLDEQNGLFLCYSRSVQQKVTASQHSLLAALGLEDGDSPSIPDLSCRKTINPQKTIRGFEAPQAI